MTRSFSEVLLRAREGLEFLHGQDPLLTLRRPEVAYRLVEGESE
jgi:hypothetical protein